MGGLDGRARVDVLGGRGGASMRVRGAVTGRDMVAPRRRRVKGHVIRVPAVPSHRAP